MTAPTPRVFFQREPFRDDWGKPPMWHVLKEEPDSKYGTYVAECGYARNNILGGVRVSRAKKPKKVAETCGKCITAMSGGRVESTAGSRKPRPKKPENPVWVLNDEGKVVQA